MASDRVRFRFNAPSERKDTCDGEREWHGEAGRPAIHRNLGGRRESELLTVLHGEIELAKLEIKSSVKSGGIGVVFFLAAAVLLVFSLTFGLIALAEGLVALHIWRWAAYLIVFGFLVLLAVLLVSSASAR